MYMQQNPTTDFQMKLHDWKYKEDIRTPDAMPQNLNERARSLAPINHHLLQQNRLEPYNQEIPKSPLIDNGQSTYNQTPNN